MNIMQGNKGIKSLKLLLWLAPVLLFVSMFSWIRPDSDLSSTVNLIFRAMGIVGAILLIPLIFCQFNFSIVWITATLGIASIGLAAYIYSGLAQITLPVKIIVATVQIIWLVFLWMQNRRDKIRKQRKYIVRAIMDELVNVVGKGVVQANKFSRVMAGVLFLGIMVYFCWFLLFFGDIQASTILIVSDIPMILLSLLLIFACVALLLSPVTYAFSNRVVVRKDIVAMTIPSFVFGTLICWIIPHPIAAVVFEYKAFWTLSITAILIWLGICLLWSVHVFRIVKRSERMNYYQKIQEKRDEYKKKV